MAEFNVTLVDYTLFSGFYGIFVPTEVTVSTSLTLDLGIAGIFGIPVDGGELVEDGLMDLTCETFRVETLLSTLTLSVTTDCGSGIDTTLSLTDSFQPTELELTTEWTSALSLVAGISYFVERPTSRCTYAPNVSGGNIDPTAPTLVDNFLVSFTCADPSASISIRRPDFNDIDEIATTRVYRNGILGDLFVYSDPQWPSSRTFTLDFTNLSETQAEDFRDFLALTIGLEVTYHDYFDREWNGIILTPNAEFSHNGKGCQYETKIQFRVIGEI